VAHRVSRHLRIEIDRYDETIRRFIPGYETMIRRAAEEIARTSPSVVLDLGAGTGALSEKMLEHDAVGTVELLDVDPEMLDRAKMRLVRFGDRARFAPRSYDEPFPACDAIAASLALHHIPELRAKRELYARAYAALRPGGVLVNADVNMPVENDRRDALYRGWADHLVASGIPEVRAWRHFEEWAEEDTYFPFEDERAALESVGFRVCRVWSEGPMGVVVASCKHPENAEKK